MSTSMPTTIQKISFVSLIAGLAAVVFLAIPVTDNFIFHTKSLALYATLAILLLLFLVKALRKGTYTITMSPLTLAYALFGGVVVASTFLANTYPVDSLLGYGGVFIATSAIVIIGSSLLPHLRSNIGVTLLVYVSLIVAATMITQLLGFGPASILNVLFGVSLPTSLAFSVTGSTLVSLQIVIIGLVGVLTHIRYGQESNSLFTFSIPVLLASVLIGIWAILPGNPAAMQLPSVQNSWFVALNSLENPRSAIIGRGPNSYGAAYDRFKPLAVNGGDEWNIQFTQAANAPLTFVVTFGLLGLAAWALIVFKFFQMFQRSSAPTKPLGWVIATTFILQLLFPVSLATLVLQATLLAMYVATEKKHYPILKIQAFAAQIVKKVTTIGTEGDGRSLLYVTFTTGLLLIVAGMYGVVRAYVAEVYMLQSSMAAQRNDAKAVYELQQRAVQLNQYNDSFRRRYGQTNLLIAQSLSSQTASADGTLSDEDKEQITRIVLQAVRETRSATVLDPANSANWLALAKVYEALIPLSEDAASLSVQAYLAAIQTNPLNPTLRINLSAMLAGQKSYQQALEVLNQAATVKPDFVPTHFARAQVLELLKQPEDAKKAYELVLQLLDDAAPESDRQEVERRITALSAIEDETEPVVDDEDETNAVSEDTIVPSLLTESLNDEADTLSKPSTEAVNFPDDEVATDAATVAPTSTTPTPSADPQAR